MPRIDGFKPNRAIDLDTRLSAVENWCSRLVGQITGLVRTSAKEVITETLSDVGSGAGTSSSGGGSAGTDATSIHGESIDDTSPVDGDILTFDTANGEWEIRQWIDGNLGIGTGANATARLQLAAGTAAASTAPGKLTAGTDLTTPEAGAVEYNGFHLEFTPTSVRKFVGLSSAHITATTTVANTVVATTLFTGAIPANSVAVAQTYVARIMGRYSTANGVDTVSLAVKVAAVTVFTIVTTASAVADVPVLLEFAFTVRTTGAGGTAWGFVEAEANAANKTQAGTAIFALDTTAAMDITIVATWSAADAGNSVSCDQGCLLALG